MERIERNYGRVSGVKDAKLIVIATEGQRTEQDYFEEFKSARRYSSSHVHLVLLKRNDTASSPKHVLQQLHRYRRQYKLGRYDELWAVVDLDRWTNEELNFVATECGANDYFLALSNPCFEVWLLLHWTDLTQYKKNEISCVCQNKQSLRKKIQEFIGSFEKGGSIHMQHFMGRIDRAINNARKLDSQPQDRWPRSTGTRVYALMENIIR